MYNRLDSIPACDRQTDGQTSCDGIVRAMHTRRAVKTGLFADDSIAFLSRLPFRAGSITGSVRRILISHIACNVTRSSAVAERPREASCH